MKLTTKIIENVVMDVAGDDVLPLVKYLKTKKNVSEFKLAEAIKKEINATRNMLYRLYENNLVSFIRKKDKKKGWYIYYWTFNFKRVKDLIKIIKKKKLIRLNERVEREKSSNFFLCPNLCIRLNFEQATEFEFKCPECGTLMNQEENKEKINELEKEINELEKEVKKLK